MKIRFTVTRFDLIKLRLWAVATNRICLGFIAVLTAILAGASWTSTAMHGHGVWFKCAFVVLNLAMVFSVTITVMVGMTVAQAFVGNARGALGEHSLRLTAEGVEESTEHSVSLFRWSALGPRRFRVGLIIIPIGDYLAHIISTKRPLIEGDLSEFLREFDRQLEKKE